MIKLKRSILILLLTVILFSIPVVSAEDTNNHSETSMESNSPERPTVLPDLSISPKDITFSYERFEGETVMKIDATITNNGFVGALAFIEFYDGEMRNENRIGSESTLMTARDTDTVSIFWVPTPGRHTILVVIKDSIPRELIKRNNAAEKTINVNENNDGLNEGGGGGTNANTDSGESLSLASVPLDDPVVATSVTGGLMVLLFALANKHYYWLANLGAIPLYSRITNGQVLKQNTRKSIYDYIASNPGVYFSFIMKDLKLKNGVTSYHLAMLEREGYIKSRHKGLYRRYYVNGANTNDVPLTKFRREIFQTICDNPGITQTKIASVLGVSNQVVSYHIGILRSSNTIRIEKDGFRSRCYTSSV